mgnify:CR=1 FL=1
MNDFYIIVYILITIATIINMAGIFVHIKQIIFYKKDGFLRVQYKLLITRVISLVLGLILVYNISYWLTYSTIYIMNILNQLIMVLVVINLYLLSVTPYNKLGIAVRNSPKIENHLFLKYSEVQLFNERNKYYLTADIIPKGKTIHKSDYEKMLSYKKNTHNFKR